MTRTGIPFLSGVWGRISRVSHECGFWYALETPGSHGPYSQAIPQWLALRVSHITVYLARRQSKMGDKDPELHQKGQEQTPGCDHGDDFKR